MSEIIDNVGKIFYKLDGGIYTTCGDCGIQCSTNCYCDCHTSMCNNCLTKSCDKSFCNCDCHKKPSDNNNKKLEKNLKSSVQFNKLRKGRGSSFDEKYGNEYIPSDGEEGKKKTIPSKNSNLSPSFNKKTARSGSIISAKTSQTVILSEVNQEEIDFANKMEAKMKKEKDQLMKNVKIRSKYSSMVVGDRISMEEKRKIGLISEFKFKDLMNEGDNYGKYNMEQSKNLTNKIAKSI